MLLEGDIGDEDAPHSAGPGGGRVRRGPKRRVPLRRVVLAVLLALLALAAAGTCALPRPGIPPGAFTRTPGTDSAVGAAGPRYRAGWPRRLLLGPGHRELWAAPVRMEVLDLATFAGGLKPERRGGGNQTRSLHLRGEDGRAYVFRSVDKDQASGMGPLRRATLGRLRQDQVGVLHPAAALVAAGVHEAAGVLHATPRLVVMPDDSALGPFRADFAGLPGVLEENPHDGFAGAPRVSGTDSLWARLRATPGERVDERAFLRARLVDVYLGDWDRHEGQWRWARRDGPGGARWVPIPRDRDYALVDYRGVAAWLARRVYSKAVRFDGEYRDLNGLLVDARPLDRRLLCPLPAAAWDSAALALRAALDDAAIAAAVRRMPPEYVRIQGDALAGRLRARRDRLPDAARRFRAALHADGACASGR